MFAKINKRRLLLALALVAMSTVACSQMKTTGPTAQHVMLSGANEVPVVATSATAMGDVDVKPDHSVSVNITVTGMTPTAAHIHEAAAGSNGGVIVPLNKVGDNRFVSADGAKMTDAQYAAYKAGNTYVNVHSAKNPGGEIRAQLKGN